MEGEGYRLFRSKGTFEPEYDSLKDIPGIFWPSEAEYEEIERSFRVLSQVIPAVFPDAVDSLNPPGDFERLLDSPFIIGGDAGPIYKAAQRSFEDLEITLLEETGIDLGRAINEGGRHLRHLGGLTVSFGTEALGTYVPWHVSVNSRGTPWGMYFFLDMLIGWAIDLYENSTNLPKPKPPIGEVFRLVFIATYRHELFHFHVEQYATKQEVLQRRPIYKPYVEGVRTKVARTERWLEEALAQAVVLESRFVGRQVGMKKAQLQSVLAPEFRRFPAGYRDFDCKTFGGPEEAHCLLAAQIVTASEKPSFHATGLITPKVEYGTNANTVPGYIAITRRLYSRFQLPTPKTRDFERYLRKKGYSVDEKAPGDHRRIMIGKWKIHLNNVRSHVDLATVKELARVEGKPLRELITEINT